MLLLTHPRACPNAIQALYGYKRRLGFEIARIIEGKLIHNVHVLKECPPINGSYEQCTNNYIPQPKNNYCECHNRWFNLCPFPYKVSEKCINKDK